MRFIMESTSNIVLYHNTSYKNLDDILKYGLLVNKSRSEEKSNFRATWVSITPVKGYGDVMLTLEIPNNIAMEKVNDSEYVIYEDIPPKYITHITYPLNNLHTITNDNLSDYIRKYGKDKVREVLRKTYNKEIGLDKVLELAKGVLQ